MAKKDARNFVGLVCSECKEKRNIEQINYYVSKNKVNNPEKLEQNKHCPKCGKHTMHIEKK